MLLQDKFKDWDIILASKSPRRRELLKGLDLNFSSVSLDIDESYSNDLTSGEITEFLCKKKAKAYSGLEKNQLLITSDTIVWLDNAPLEKPKTKDEAKKMLWMLSNNQHEVITSVGIFSIDKEKVITDTAVVTFGQLSQEEIDYYVDNYSPMDKAGSYGIQEWIGYIGVEKIEGSYFTVMGLPLFKLYNALKEF